MLGKHLNTAEAAIALGVNRGKFCRSYEPDLDFVLDKKGKKLFKIPFERMTQKAQAAYANSLEEWEEPLEELEKLVSPTEGSESTLDELSQARLENIRVRTRLLEESVKAKKEELFSEWSERFFDVFSTSFAKFKTGLLELRLQGEQLEKLNECLELCVKALEDNLYKIKGEYLEEEENEEEANV